MKEIILPKWLEPAGDFNLIRLGRDRDGGYLVDSRDIAAADFLVSLGVNDDWSFDKDFLERRDVPLHAFDGTIDRVELAKKVLKAIGNRKYVKAKSKALYDYGKFFSGKRHHHAQNVGLRNTPGFVTLHHILSEYTPSGNVFLKIDIERWEYRLLHDILAGADRICGLVIEFHDLDLHHERVQEFVEKLPLSIAHVHCNTVAPISDDGLPHVLEVTFTSHPPVNIAPVKLPHSLDRLSAPHHERCEIRFTP